MTEAETTGTDEATTDDAGREPGRGRVAYLVTSHANPGQVERLVRRLRRDSPGAGVVVSHDGASSALDPAAFSDLDGVHVLFAGRPLEWGDFSLVERLADALRWTVANLEFDWLVVLSGQDYPIRPLAELEEHLVATSADAVFVHRTVRQPGAGSSPEDDQDWRRYHFRYFRLPASLARVVPADGPAPAGRGDAGPRGGRPGRARSRPERLLRWIERRQSLVMLRRMPRGLRPRLGVRRWSTPYGPDLVCTKGSLWLTVRRRALERALAFVDANPGYVAHYRRTVIPDESFFQTILANDPEVSVSDEPLRYRAWGPANRGSPAVLGTGDLEAMVASGRYLARKFDAAADAEVLDRLDEAAARPPAG